MAERGLWLAAMSREKRLKINCKEAGDSNKRTGCGCITCPFYSKLDCILCCKL